MVAELGVYPVVVMTATLRANGLSDVVGVWVSEGVDEAEPVCVWLGVGVALAVMEGLWLRDCDGLCEDVALWEGVAVDEELGVCVVLRLGVPDDDGVWLGESVAVGVCVRLVEVVAVPDCEGLIVVDGVAVLLRVCVDVGV